jgi:hypothetical protein
LSITAVLNIVYVVAKGGFSLKQSLFSKSESSTLISSNLLLLNLSIADLLFAAAILEVTLAWVSRKTPANVFAMQRSEMEICFISGMTLMMGAFEAQVLHIFMTIRKYINFRSLVERISVYKYMGLTVFSWACTSIFSVTGTLLIHSHNIYCLPFVINSNTKRQTAYIYVYVILLGINSCTACYVNLCLFKTMNESKSASNRIRYTKAEIQFKKHAIISSFLYLSDCITWLIAIPMSILLEMRGSIIFEFISIILLLVNHSLNFVKGNSILFRIIISILSRHSIKS